LNVIKNEEKKRKKGYTIKKDKRSENKKKRGECSKRAKK